MRLLVRSINDHRYARKRYRNLAERIVESSQIRCMHAVVNLVVVQPAHDAIESTVGGSTKKLVAFMGSMMFEAYALTVIYYDECLTSKDLYRFDPDGIKNRLRKQLERSGFKQPMIGCLEVDYHSELKKWLPHFHLLVLGDPAPVTALRRYFKKHIEIKGRTTSVNRPVHMSVIKNKEKQLSYLCKSYWTHVVAYTDEHGKRRTRKIGLKGKQLQLSLLVLDRIGYSGLLFLYSVRRHGSELVNSAVSEQRRRSSDSPP